MKTGNFYLHNQNGVYLNVNKRTLKSAIDTAKTYQFPVQVSQLIKDITPYFKLKYAHIPELNKFHKGTQMSSNMLKRNIFANTL